MTALLLPTDGCPACITVEHVAIAHPYRVESDGETVYGWYRCPECQYSWWTGWSPKAASLPCLGCPACNETDAARPQRAGSKTS